jgi:hypothetical protein
MKMPVSLISSEPYSRGTVKLSEKDTRTLVEFGSGDSHDAGYLSPGLERPSAGTAMISGLGVGRAAEEVCSLTVNGEKALGLPD